MEQEAWRFLDFLQKVHLIENVYLCHSDVFMPDFFFQHPLKLRQLGFKLATSLTPMSEHRYDGELVLVQHGFKVVSADLFYNVRVFFILIAITAF